jgi:acyl-CoA thioesterase-1
MWDVVDYTRVNHHELELPFMRARVSLSMSIKRIIVGVLLSFNLITVQAAEAKKILVYGDSLSAAYGLNLEQGWVSLLGEKLGDQYQVINASISGETSGGGLARLPATLDEFSPDLVLLELGANDGLRGFDTAKLEQNLIEMINLVTQNGSQVVVFGLTLPPSYGPRYIDLFEATFVNAARQTNQKHYDFVVERFIGNEAYIQPDGLHPTALAQPEIAELVYQFLRDNKLLD